MFKLETVRKISKSLRDLFEAYKAALKRGEHLTISISKGNRKIGRVMNVSIAPIISCGNCSHCSGYCYDVKACLQYENVRKARTKNMAIAMEARDEYFEQIDAAMSRRRTNKYFRWHVGGEIPDADYFRRMVENAWRHPDFTIWTYTKMYWFVNDYIQENGRDAIPGNMHIMFSEWDGMPIDNPYNMPMFTVKMAAGNVNHDPEFFEGLWRCPGNCDICKAAGRGCLASETTYADEH